MAKGSATENTLGGLHSKVAAVFIKVLDRYEARMDASEVVSGETISDEMLELLLDEGNMPNPAMLSAITKFLKDNNIGFDTEQMEELSSQERRLAERRDKRAGMASLTTLRAVGD